MMGQVREKIVEFPSRYEPSTLLEGRLHLPPGEGRRPGVVLCHPHPLHGGSHQVRVIVQIARELAGRGFAALRFNFRGVDRSQGQFGGGMDEVQDVGGAVDFLGDQAEVDPTRVALVGYSFGASVGLRYAVNDGRIQAVALVALPTWSIEDQKLQTYTRPRLFIVGAEDNIAPPAKLQAWVEQLPEPKQFLILPGTDHFFIDREAEVARLVAKYFSSTQSTQRRVR